VNEQMLHKSISHTSKYSVLNVISNTQKQYGERTDDLSSRIQLVEGLFVKYANVLGHKVPGRHSSDNTVPRQTETFQKQASTVLGKSKLPPS
jgi:hypothetical protein